PTRKFRSAFLVTKLRQCPVADGQTVEPGSFVPISVAWTTDRATRTGRPLSSRFRLCRRRLESCERSAVQKARSRLATGIGNITAAAPIFEPPGKRGIDRRGNAYGRCCGAAPVGGGWRRNYRHRPGAAAAARAEGAHSRGVFRPPLRRLSGSGADPGTAIRVRAKFWRGRTLRSTGQQAARSRPCDLQS